MDRGSFNKIVKRKNIYGVSELKLILLNAINVDKFDIKSKCKILFSGLPTVC
jgi:hypothetical protein